MLVTLGPVSRTASPSRSGPGGHQPAWEIERWRRERLVAAAVADVDDDGEQIWYLDASRPA